MIDRLQSPPADSVRTVLREVFSTPSYTWEERRHPLAFLWEWYQGFLDWLTTLQETHPIAYWVLLTGLLLLLAAILTHFGYLIWRSLRPRALPERAIGAPAPTVRDAAWHLREARRLAGEGRYAEALGHRFGALVLELDRRGVLRFDPSKTPAEYALEVRLGESGRERFAALVQVLYQALFRGTACSVDDVEQFDQSARELVSVAAH